MGLFTICVFIRCELICHLLSLTVHCFMNAHSYSIQAVFVLHSVHTNKSRTIIATKKIAQNIKTET